MVRRGGSTSSQRNAPLNTAARLSDANGASPSPPTPLPQGARGEECQFWHHSYNTALSAYLLPSPLAGEGLGVRGSPPLLQIYT